MTTHQLRPYQTQFIGDVHQAWAQGSRNVLGVAPTGSGKTVIFSNVIAAEAGASVAIAHRRELVGQMSLALAREGVRHRVVGPDSVRRACVQWHMDELGRSYFDPNSKYAVAGVDSLINMPADDPWLRQVQLWVMDEAHHTLEDNKWGKAVSMFPNARGLGVTATPCRADGKGLGAHADGVFHKMVVGPSMRDLIREGYLTDYKIVCPPVKIDLSNVHVTASGDFSPSELREARHKSSVTGDVVAHYLKFARGKRGVTFEVDVESAVETATAFRAAGVPAEVVSAKTPDMLRATILKRFRNGEILQLVNVDLFGEGFDLPAIEVVSMARPTESFSLYCLDPETEVLTPDGWLSAERALQCREVIAYELHSGKTKTVPVTGSVCRPLMPNEYMVALDSPHLSLCVSDQHDLVVQSASGTARNWQKQTAAHVATRNGLMRVPVAGRGDFVGSGLTRAELHFLGWFLSDGSLNKATNAITISQSSNKQDHIDSIRQSIEGCGFKYGFGVYRRKNVPGTHADLVRFTVSHGLPRGRDKHLTGWSRISKWVNKSIPTCYDTLTREELLVMLETWNLGDGSNQTSSLKHTPRTLRISCGNNRVMADRLQAMCVQRGLRANIHCWNEPGRSEWYNVHIKNTDYSTIAGTGVVDGAVGGKKPYERSRLTRVEHRPPFVWCLTNPLGTLVTRRQGRVVIVGNCQQFGRALRIMAGKEYALILDHVGNVMRHRPPDAKRTWTLDRRERRGSNGPSDAIPIRVCDNPECNTPYERVLLACPNCGHEPVPAARSTPAQVDGDLQELDPAVLAALRGEIEDVNEPIKVPYGLGGAAAGGYVKQKGLKKDAQRDLQYKMAVWGGWQASLGRSVREAQKRFFFRFGMDVLSAMALNAKEAEKLYIEICDDLDENGVIDA